jgi:hypothetical protein
MTNLEPSAGLPAGMRRGISCRRQKKEGLMTNTEIEEALAREAQCDKRTARKALEHGYRTIRSRDVRDRIAFALRRRPELGKLYSKEHYP